MDNRSLSWMKQTTFASMLALTLTTALLAPGKAEDVALEATSTTVTEKPMLLRTVPLEVSSVPQAEGLDQAVQTADGTYEFMTSTDSLLLHMETLRRAYAAYGQIPEERAKLMKALKARYLTNENDPIKFFDYGYAQLVMEANKNGLFFLRKANDKIGSPYTSLAYGLAQVDTDIIFENAPPDAMTTRKMDVGYKLKDALIFNRDDMKPGVWPSYVRILEGLKPYEAYSSLINEDVTTIYVPYGATSSSPNSALMALSMADGNTVESDQSTTTATSRPPEVAQTCSFSSTPVNWNQLKTSKSLDLDQDGTTDSINFFLTGTPNAPYEVRILNGKNQVIGELKSHKGPHITEDIDGDGKMEIVVRQFDKDPYHPIYVYRWNGSCYAEDKQVSAYFK